MVTARIASRSPRFCIHLTHRKYQNAVQNHGLAKAKPKPERGFGLALALGQARARKTLGRKMLFEDVSLSLNTSTEIVVPEVKWVVDVDPEETAVHAMHFSFSQMLRI